MDRARTERIVSRVESVVRIALDQHLDKHNRSQSDYIRELIITDLRKCGLLPDALLADLLVSQ